MRGPPKSAYFIGKGKVVSDFCSNITKFGEVERFVASLRELFGLKEEEDTYVSEEGEWL
jgi:hypothetical protein